MKSFRGIINVGSGGLGEVERLGARVRGQPSPPTIEAEPDDAADGGPVVTWAVNDGQRNRAAAQKSTLLATPQERNVVPRAKCELSGAQVVV